MELGIGNWKTIIIDDKKYSIRSIEKDGIWNILLTNLQNLWFENLDEKIILQKCEKLNPNLSTEDVNVVPFVAELLENVEKTATKKSTERIEFAQELEGGIFHFSIDLTPGNALQLWEEVTMPLCLVAGELCRRQTLLLDLVRKKDDEIAEYKLNGGELTRKHIETKPFHADLFKENAPKLNAEGVFSAFEAVMESQGDIELEIISSGTNTAVRRSTEEHRPTKNSIKIHPSEVKDVNLVRTNQVPERSGSKEINEIGESSKVLPQIVNKNSSKLEKKLKTYESEEDEKDSPRKARSAPSLPVKRPKRTIHDFIT